MGVDFARFVAGQQPWSKFEDRDGGRAAKVYGPSGTGSGIGQGEGAAKSTVVEDAIASTGTGRKPEIVDIANAVGWDSLGAVFIDFILGKHLG